MRIGVAAMALTICSMTTSAYADTEKSLALVLEVLTDGDDHEPGVTVFHHLQAADGALGGYVFSLMDPEYAVIHGGPTLTFGQGDTMWRIGFGAGIEQNFRPDDRNPLRLATFGLYTHGRHSMLAILEIGADQRKFIEPFWNASYAFTANQWFDFGLISRRHVGTGPTMNFWLHRPGLGIGLSPVYDHETEAFAFELSFMTGY